MDCCSLMDTTRPFDAIILITMGLTISVGHCVGMCGPLVSAFALAQRQRGRTTRSLLGYSVVYHVGRVTSYALLGAAMGLAGSTILFGDQGRPVEGVLSLVIAVVMLLLGLGMLGVIPAERILEKLPWQNRVTCALREALAAPNLPRSYAMGFANGWLPCGPVLMAAATAAATGSVWKGALAMAYFGLGTIPVLILLMLGVGKIRAAARVHLNRVSAALVIVVAVQLGLRGLAAWGVVPHLAWGEVVFW